MDVIGELYQSLFMAERRPPKILHAQADYLIRVLPGLLDLERGNRQLHPLVETRKGAR